MIQLDFHEEVNIDWDYGSLASGGCARTGALAGKADVVAAVRSMHNVLGGTIDPHAAYLLLRGMKTLDVRVQRQNSVRTLLVLQTFMQHQRHSEDVRHG